MRKGLLYIKTAPFFVRCKLLIQVFKVKNTCVLVYVRAENGGRDRKVGDNSIGSRLRLLQSKAPPDSNSTEHAILDFGP